MGIKQRKSYANYLNVGASVEEYVLMNAGFTELNEAPAAQAGSKKYIGDKSATKSIIGYDWSTTFNTDMIRSEKAVEFICNIGEMQLVGTDAESSYIIVDLDKQGSEANTFKARKFKVAIEVASFDNNDGELAATGNLLGIGDLVVGTFNVTTKTFTAGFNEALGVLNVTSSAGLESGKTTITVMPTLTIGNSRKYKIAASLTLPTVNENCDSGYTVWDGTSEIIATTGNKILMVEIDSSNKVKKAGIATVTSKV
ncbi:MAG: hypothetical protein RR636_14490 [Clostridium sp.]|uniref:hypothetical protein n=1 Tax=Clostridium sp. TaxID=1506 RepID=UPI003054C29F